MTRDIRTTITTIIRTDDKENLPVDWVRDLPGTHNIGALIIRIGFWGRFTRIIKRTRTK